MANYDPERYWRIDDFVASGIIRPIPTYTVGEKASVKLGFERLPGESEDDYTERINQIRDRRKSAGKAQWETTINDDVVYSERPHDGDTVLIGFQPPSNESVDYSAWGLLEDIDSFTPPDEFRHGFEFTFCFLADYDEYPDKNAVEQEMKRSGFH